jgi:peroxiredoxin
MRRLLQTIGIGACVLMTLTVTLRPPAYGITLKKVPERKKAPDFELKDSEGRTVHLSDYRGKVVLLDFWATWCIPCKAEIPWLEELHKKYEAEGLAVVGISMDREGWPVVRPFLEKKGVTYPILLGNPRVAYLYGDVDALPVAFFVDREQRVAAIHPGAASRKQVESLVKALLSGDHEPM